MDRSSDSPLLARYRRLPNLRTRCRDFVYDSPLPGGAGLGFLDHHPVRICEPREGFLQSLKKDSVLGKFVLSRVQEDDEVTKSGTSLDILFGREVLKPIFNRSSKAAA